MPNALRGLIPVDPNREDTYTDDLLRHAKGLTETGITAASLVPAMIGGG